MRDDAGAPPRGAEREALGWFLRLVAWDLALLHGVPSGAERCTKTPDPRRRASILRADARRAPQV